MRDAGSNGCLYDPGNTLVHSGKLIGSEDHTGRSGNNPDLLTLRKDSERTCDPRDGLTATKGTSDLEDVCDVACPGVDGTAALNYGGC